MGRLPRSRFVRLNHTLLMPLHRLKSALSSRTPEKETKLPALYTASAIVPTETAKRYSKQLAAHLGRKAEIRTEPDGERIVLTSGSCLLLSREEALELRAESDTPEGLERIKEVTGSHLERFGQRAGLVVRWLQTV
jgi:uncharacterized protein